MTAESRGDSRVAVIVGGSSGIGRAVALALADQGWSLILAGRSTEALESTAVSLSKRGGRASRHRRCHRHGCDDLRFRHRHRSVRSGGCGGEHGGGRRLRTLRVGTGRGFRASDLHEPDRLGERSPGGPAPLPGPRRRAPDTSRITARQDRGAVHESLRGEQVGRARPGPHPQDRGQAITRDPGQHDLARQRQHPGLSARGELRGPGRSATTTGRPTGKGRSCPADLAQVHGPWTWPRRRRS